MFKKCFKWTNQAMLLLVFALKLLNDNLISSIPWSNIRFCVLFALHLVHWLAFKVTYNEKAFIISLFCTLKYINGYLMSRCSFRLIFSTAVFQDLTMLRDPTLYTLPWLAAWATSRSPIPFNRWEPRIKSRQFQRPAAFPSTRYFWPWEIRLFISSGSSKLKSFKNKLCAYRLSIWSSN
jgi:hypothetical protein